MKTIYEYEQEVNKELLSAIIYGDMSFQDYYTGETEKQLSIEYNTLMVRIQNIQDYISLYVDNVSHVESVEDNNSESWNTTVKIIFLVDNDCKFEIVDCFENWLWWQKKGLMYTTTSYGKKIPTMYMIDHRGRNKRVYNCIYSNYGILYIKNKGKDVIVEDINPSLGLAVINTEFVLNA